MDAVAVDQRIEARALALEDLIAARPVEVKGILGRTLKADVRFPSLITRVAKARGIDVSDDGRLRCPLDFTNGGEFTDLNMTNCGPKLSGAALDAARGAGRVTDAVGSMRTTKRHSLAARRMSEQISAVILDRPSRIRETDDLDEFDTSKRFTSRLKTVRARRPAQLFRTDAQGAEVTEGDLAADRHLRTVGINIAAEAARLADERTAEARQARAVLKAKIDRVDTQLADYYRTTGTSMLGASFENVTFSGVGVKQEDSILVRIVTYTARSAEGDDVTIDVEFPHHRAMLSAPGAPAAQRVNIRRTVGAGSTPDASIVVDADQIVAAHMRNHLRGGELKVRLYREMDEIIANPRTEFAEAAFEALEQLGVKRGSLDDATIDASWNVGDDRIREALKDIAPYLPQAWWDRALAKPLRFEVDSESARAFFIREGARESIVMGGKRVGNPDDFRSTLLHEVMHAIQSDNEVHEAEYVFWKRVTGSVAVAPLGGDYDDDEVGVVDDFDRAYLGKVYHSNTGRPHAPSEISPVLVQQLYGRASMNFGGDNDSLYWILGAMAEIR